MADIVVRHLPLLLLLAGVLILVLTGRPLFGSGALSARQNLFKSLAPASPVLGTLIVISVIGKPFLEHLQRNDWQSDLMGPTWLQVVVTVFVVSLYATIGAILFFFYRAVRNINFFSGRRVRAPYSIFVRTTVQLLGVAVLIVLAIVAALNPPLASHAWQLLVQFF